MYEVGLFGAPLDSGNRGVEALGLSVVHGVSRWVPGSRLVLFDNGLGRRPRVVSGALDVDVVQQGVRRSKRFYRPESWTSVWAAQALSSQLNPVAKAIATADVILDISGGDSFSDIYGLERLRTVLAPKRATLRAGRPLVLLPQTYGPFASSSAQTAAAHIVRRASVCFARDETSYEVLLDLLGHEADPVRHRLGVDVAFALPTSAPAGRLWPTTAEWIDRRQGRPLVGLNVSGLLLSDPSSQARFGLILDYRRLCGELVERLVAEDADVLLVPHVRSRGGRGESDRPASQELLEQLSSTTRSQVRVLQDDLDAREVKWVISQCDWFCGTRMHATIAALSTATPTAAVAYSMKTAGVFATVRAEEHVIDASTTDTPAALDLLLHGWSLREDARVHLSQTAPPVVERASAQIRAALEWERPHLHDVRSVS